MAEQRLFRAGRNRRTKNSIDSSIGGVSATEPNHGVGERALFSDPNTFLSCGLPNELLGGVNPPSQSFGEASPPALDSFGVVNPLSLKLQRGKLEDGKGRPIWQQSVGCVARICPRKGTAPIAGQRGVKLLALGRRPVDHRNQKDDQLTSLSLG